MPPPGTACIAGSASARSPNRAMPPQKRNSGPPLTASKIILVWQSGIAWMSRNGESIRLNLCSTPINSSTNSTRSIQSPSTTHREARLNRCAPTTPPATSPVATSTRSAIRPACMSPTCYREISVVGDFTRRMVEVAEGKKPVWIYLQIAWSGVIKPGKTLRFPTLSEQRFMTYQAIIAGARGLIYFGGQLPQALSPEDARLGWNWTFWRRVLKPVIEEIGDKSPLYPALVAPESKLPISSM